MKNAFVFPGQGSQFSGMGKKHYDNNAFAKKLFEQANEILGFRISDIMFTGTEEELKQTKVTQPAVFLHSVIAFKGIDRNKPEMVAGHSLGEFSALVANTAPAAQKGTALTFVICIGFAITILSIYFLDQIMPRLNSPTNAFTFLALGPAVGLIMMLPLLRKVEA